MGGYAAEVIRSAILSVPKGQWEAATTIGMGYATTLRRIILPQAARTAVPPLSNTLISLVKDTSLASVVLVTELLRVAQIAAAPTFQFFALYGVAALYYWVICLVLSFVQSRLETRAGKASWPDDRGTDERRPDDGDRRVAAQRESACTSASTSWRC